MTTVYNEYLTAIQEGTINLQDVNFSVHAVGEYTPDTEHTFNDFMGNEETPGLAEIKSTAESALTGDVILTDSMSEIIEHLKTALGEVADAKYYTVFDPVLQILCFTEEIWNLERNQ